MYRDGDSSLSGKREAIQAELEVASKRKKALTQILTMAESLKKSEDTQKSSTSGLENLISDCKRKEEIADAQINELKNTHANVVNWEDRQQKLVNEYNKRKLENETQKNKKLCEELGQALQKVNEFPKKLSSIGSYINKLNELIAKSDATLRKLKKTVSLERANESSDVAKMPNFEIQNELSELEQRLN